MFLYFLARQGQQFSRKCTKKMEVFLVCIIKILQKEYIFSIVYPSGSTFVSRSRRTSGETNAKYPGNADAKMKLIRERSLFVY